MLVRHHQELAPLFHLGFHGPLCAGAPRAGDEVGAESSLSLIAQCGLVPLPLAPLPPSVLDLVVLVPHPSALDVVFPVLHPSALDVVFLVLPPSALEVVVVLPPTAPDVVFPVLPPSALDVFRVALPHALVAYCARLLGLFPRAINLLLVARVQELLPRVLLHVALFSLPRSGWLERVFGLSAGDADEVESSKEASFVLLQEFGLERVHLVLDVFLLVHGDDDASVLVGGELVLALRVASVGVQNLVVVAAAAAAAAAVALADNGVVVRALGLVVHRGVGVQAQNLAFEA